MRVIDTNSHVTSAHIAVLKSKGVGGVLRYLGTWPSGKGMDKAEADRIRAAGLGLGAIYESGTDQTLGGKAQGTLDARKAQVELDRLGAPAGAFVWFACDTDTADYATTNAYMAGAVSVLGLSRCGLYGSHYIIRKADEAGVVAKTWQSQSRGWRESRADYPKATLIQGFADYGTIAGLDYDANAATGDWGAWGAPPKEEPVSTAAQFIKIAASQDNTKEKPSGSNNVKYNTWYYGHPVSGAAYPWCAAYISWVFAQVAGGLDLIYGKSVSTVQMAARFDQHDRFDKTPKVGAIAFYDFVPKAKIQHVGLVAKVYPDKSIDAWEGNTAVGNDSNGGEVMLRHRAASVVVGYGHPKYTAVVPPAPSPDPSGLEKATLIRDSQGYNGPPTFGTKRALLKKGGNVLVTQNRAKKGTVWMREVESGGKRSWIDERDLHYI